MANEDSKFDHIVNKCPIDPITHTCEWVKWVRDEGYEQRMHGGVLHGLILDKLVGYTEAQETEVKSSRNLKVFDCSDFEITHKISIGNGLGDQNGVNSMFIMRRREVNK